MVSCWLKFLFLVKFFFVLGARRSKWPVGKRKRKSDYPRHDAAYLFAGAICYFNFALLLLHFLFLKLRYFQ